MRVQCVVPFCQHTRAWPDGAARWICTDHWSACDKRLRLVYKRLQKTGDDRLRSHVFQRLVAQAVERAAGVD